MPLTVGLALHWPSVTDRGISNYCTLVDWNAAALTEKLGWIATLCLGILKVKRFIWDKNYNIML